MWYTWPVQKYGGKKFKKFITPPTLQRNQVVSGPLLYFLNSKAMNTLKGCSHELHVMVTCLELLCVKWPCYHFCLLGVYGYLTIGVRSKYVHQRV